MVDDVSLGELARITAHAVSRIEAIAERLESGQFVRTDIFERSERELVRQVGALELDVHALEEKKASNETLQAVSAQLKTLAAQTVLDDLARRVTSLESTNVWLVRTVVGFIIVAVLALVVTQSGGA